MNKQAETNQSPETLTFDIESQHLILAMLLQKPEWAEAFLELLEPEYFDHACDQEFMQIIQQFFQTYHRPITLDEMVEEVNRFVNERPELKDEYLKRFTEILGEMGPDKDFSYVHDRVREFVGYQAQKNMTIDHAHRLKKVGQKGAAQAFEEMKADVSKIDSLQKGGERSDKLDTVNLADVEPKEVEWLWWNRIPKGKLSLIVGDPGVGKSYFTIWLAALVTTGQPLPGHPVHLSEKGKVIILTAEDGLADTVVPRIDLHNGDRSLVIVVRGTREEDGGYRQFNLAKDIQALEDLIINEGDIKLVIIDPVSAYLGMGKDVDSHKDKDVRGVLTPVANLAEKHNVTILGVLHLNKSTELGAIYRVSGSMAFVAAARAVWLLEREKRDEEDKSLRYFTPIKTNLSVDPESIVFKIENGVVTIQEETGIPTPTADELLAPRELPKRDSATEDAKHFLIEMLKEGPVDQKEISEAAKAEMISEYALRKAKKVLRIISDPQYSTTGVKKWLWRFEDAEGER